MDFSDKMEFSPSAGSSVLFHTVHLLRPGFLNDADQVSGIGQVPVMQDEMRIFHMGILVKVVYLFCIEHGTAALDTVNKISLFQ